MTAESTVHTGRLRTIPAFALVSAALLAILFAINVYRAATQSITIDEAFTYNHFVKVPYSQFESHVSYNNHPLNTLLCKISVALLGLSDLSLRLPSVLAGLLYFVALFRLCRLLFGDSAWLLVAVALTSLNPYTLDQLSAARGYGMGLAFWTLGAGYAVRWVSEGLPNGRWRRVAPLVTVGVAFGLAAGSQLNEVFAVAAMAVPLLAIGFVRALAGGLWSAWRALALDALSLFGAAVAVALPLVWTPLRAADAVDGVPKYRGAVQAFFDALIFYRPTALAFWPRLWVGLHVWPFPLLLVFLGLLLAASALILYRWLRVRRTGSPSMADRQMLLFSLTALLTFFLLRLEPRLMHHTYFTGRRLLFTVPVLFITVPLGIRWVSRQFSWSRALEFAGAVPLALLTLQFALEFNTQWYSDWKFDAGTKRMANVLRARRPAAGAPPLTIGSDWRLKETLNYYRTLYGLSWIASVDWYFPERYYNLYAVDEKDLTALAPLEVVPLYRDSVSGMVLAEPGRRPLAALREMGFSGSPVHGVDVHLDGASVELGHAGARQHLLRDFMCDADKDAWCWTFARPAMLFRVPRKAGWKFRMHLTIVGKTFDQTGPVHLTVWVDGAAVGEKRFDGPGDSTFEFPVPARLLRDDGLVLVETTMDHYYVAPEDGQNLGYLLAGAGFVENSISGSK